MPLTKAQAKSLDILEVARSLGMEMKRKSHREYYWAEHDSFKIDTVKNTWHWYSQNLFGDTINLVQQMQNVSYKDAMVFLETGSFPEAKPVEEERKPFNYTLAPYEQPFVEARAYLKEIRGLSDDTIDFFLEKGVLAQAKRKDKEGVIEDVLVFKYLDRNQQLVGASLQGLVPDQERHPGKGYLKQIMYQSEAISGLNVSIGSPKRLIVTEAPIDLMSYYELHKGELNDVRLVAMEGLKEGVLSHYVLEILQERGDIPMDERDYTKSSELARTSRFLSVAAETSTLFQDHKYDDLITLAVDRDKAGTDFISKLREKKIPVVDARPPEREGQEKTDWNEILKQEKQLEKDEEIQLSSSFPDTSHLSPEDATWLKENWNNISFSVQSTSSSEASPAVEEKQPLNDQESIANAEENAVRLISYEEVKQENEVLTKRLNNRIQSGELSIEFAPDFYLYDVFAKLGNSHPTKYLNDKRMEVLSPIHSLLSSIDDQTIDLYKKKGTPEQDSLYQALKPHQRTLGVDISTRFIGELAIAAYSTNKQIESLSSDSFGVYFGERTLDNLSQSVERMLEYPLIESGTRDFAHGFVTTPNTLFHYLEEQEGEVVLNRELLDNLMSRLETHPIKIMEDSEEVEPVRPVIVLKQDELYSDYWRVYQSDGELEFYLFEDGQFGYRQYGSLSQKEDNIVFKYHSEPGKTEFLATQMGYDSLKYIVVKDWESLFDENKALLRENFVFDDLENFLKKSNYFELDYWTFNSGLKEDEEFLNEITKKAHDQNQELSNNTGGELLNRNSSFLGVETPGTAPQPVEKNSQPDFPANVHLHFTIDEDRMSNKIFRKNMRTLNLYANAMRDSAQWYLKEMSGTSIHYVYKNPEEK